MHLPQPQPHSQPYENGLGRARSAERARVGVVGASNPARWTVWCADMRAVGAEKGGVGELVVVEEMRIRESRWLEEWLVMMLMVRW